MILASSPGMLIRAEGLKDLSMLGLVAALGAFGLVRAIRDLRSRWAPVTLSAAGIEAKIPGLEQPKFLAWRDISRTKIRNVMGQKFVWLYDREGRPAFYIWLGPLNIRASKLGAMIDHYRSAANAAE